MDVFPVDISFWVLAVIGVLLTGISKSGFAGGAGVVAVPLLALTIPAPVAATLMLPLLIVMDVKTIHYYRKNILLSELRAITPAALLGIVFGGLIMGAMPTQWFQVLLGILSIVFALWHKLGAILGNIPGGAWIWGTASGVSSTLLHAGGPPINIYFTARNMPKERWLATAAVFFAVMNIVKVIPYGVLGQWQLNVFFIDIILLPVAIAGVWLGYRIQKIISDESFLNACKILLFMSGVTLIAKHIVSM